MRIEGHTFLTPSFTDSLEQSFVNREFELGKIVDSLFCVYENIGFFNVKFDVRVDTIQGDTAFIYIKPFVKFLPVIKSVELEGVGFYRNLKNKYFPFSGRVFRRKRLLNSLLVLKNAGVVEGGDYRFIRLTDREYILHIRLEPYDEFLQIQIIEGKEGLMGSVDISKASIFSSGISVSIGSRIENDTSYYYSLNAIGVLPYTKGFFVGGEYYGSVGGFRVSRYSVNIQYISPTFKFEISGIRRNGIRMYGGSIDLYGNNVRFNIYGSYGNSMFYGGVFGYFHEKGFSFSLEHLMTYHLSDGILFISLPLKNEIAFLKGEEYMNSFFIMRSKMYFYKNFSIFCDLFSQRGNMTFDGGFSYLRKKVGLYLGYVIQENVRDLRLGLVLGSRNSLFERSMHIL